MVFRLIVAALAAIALTVHPTSAAACPGDCNNDGVVSIDELINGVNILLGSVAVDRCAACDRNQDGVVTIDELIDAVTATLVGCPATPTSTPKNPPTNSATATPTPSAVSTGSATATPANCHDDGIICTVAGDGRAGPYDTSFYYPIDLAFDRSGKLLIMDWNNVRLRRLNDDGTMTTIMGLMDDEGNPIEGAPIDGALASDTPLHHASDIEFDDAFNMYVAGDHVSVVFRVGTDDRVFAVAGKRDLDGSFIYGYSGDHGPALQAELGVPFGVLPDRLGGLYISDVDACVVRYVDPQGMITTVAGTGEPGYSGDGHPGTQAQLAGPSRLKFGPDGNLYFCETKNHVIRRLHPDGTIDTFAGTGSRGYRDGPAIAAQFDTPYDLRFAPNGDVYVADTGNNVIRRIDTAGMVTTVVGNHDGGFDGDGGPASGCLLRRPSAIIFDAEGSMWIADTSNERVRRVWHYLSATPPPAN